MDALTTNAMSFAGTEQARELGKLVVVRNVDMKPGQDTTGITSRRRPGYSEAAMAQAVGVRPAWECTRCARERFLHYVHHHRTAASVL